MSYTKYPNIHIQYDYIKFSVILPQKVINLLTLDVLLIIKCNLQYQKEYKSILNKTSFRNLTLLNQIIQVPVLF